MGAEADGKEALKGLMSRLHGGADPEEVKDEFRGQRGGVSPAELARMEEEHKRWMRRGLRWVNEHPELFPEWRSVRYFVKTVAGEESERHLVIWGHDSPSDFEAYKSRRAGYLGPYEEYKENDPYYQGVFDHQSMKVEIWKDLERDLWIE